MGEPRSRVRLELKGVVQGVGFRPLVYTLARDLGLTGFVRNEGGCVTLELEGPSEALEAFEPRLRQSLPTQARIDEWSCQVLAPLGEGDFVIAPSRESGRGALIPPDLASCPECLRELLDPQDRRYRYPLLNCTACGPRYTVIQALPYDRRHTTLRSFPLCEDCRREYLDPSNRRFHAQPTACARCGPQVWARREETRVGPEQVQGDPEQVQVGPEQTLGVPERTPGDPVECARAALLRGQTVAVKGLGGYHLACRADLPEAVVRLRERKLRPHRPLALMVRDLEVARRWVAVSDPEAELLSSPARPVVLLPALQEPGPLAPGQRHLGLMLPYTPLHELLLQPPLDSLVMTSGNLSGEPICTEDPEQLRAFCDMILGHDRPIAVACEDSVIQPGPRGPIPIRRSRGYAPAPIRVAQTLPPLLAVGAELKATLAMACDHHVWLSGHIGDVSTYACLERLQSTARHLEGLLGFSPEFLVADMHPGYLSRRWAEQEAHRRGLPLLLVQHHHAHVAALLAEHGWPSETPVLAFVFDGTGWGLDGTVWGGEVLRASYEGFERLAYLDPVTLPGGEAAIRAPYRLALSYLRQAGLEWDPRLPCVAAASPLELRNLPRVPGPLSSSAGRLFDAVSSLLGVCQQVTYEGQAACDLEAACQEGVTESLTFELAGQRILWRPAFQELAEGLLGGASVAVLASRFHNGLADLILELSLSEGLPVALSGGCFHNQRLLAAVVERLDRAGVQLLLPRLVPANDGGLALGQALVAAHQKRQG